MTLALGVYILYFFLDIPYHITDSVINIRKNYSLKVNLRSFSTRSRKRKREIPTFLFWFWCVVCIVGFLEKKKEIEKKGHSQNFVKFPSVLIVYTEHDIIIHTDYCVIIEKFEG